MSRTAAEPRLGASADGSLTAQKPRSSAGSEVAWRSQARRPPLMEVRGGAEAMNEASRTPAGPSDGSTEASPVLRATSIDDARSPRWCPQAPVSPRGGWSPRASTKREALHSADGRAAMCERCVCA